MYLVSLHVYMHYDGLGRFEVARDGGLDGMPAWALRTRSRVVSLASQQGGGWVPLRWLRRVLTEWRVVVLQGQEQWRGEAVKRLRVASGFMCMCEWCEDRRVLGFPLD